jgi:hypothetical protein
MTNHAFQHRIGQIAAFLAALVLVLPPLPAIACACAVPSDRQACCGHCGRDAQNESQQAAKTCCVKHEQKARPARECCHRHAPAAGKRLADSSSHESVCHCQHGRQPETPVVPVGQSHGSLDQLLLAQAAVSTAVVPASLPASSVSSACHEFCLAADMPLERCILLSRLTL